MRAYPASRISKEARDTSAICMKSWIPTYEPTLSNSICPHSSQPSSSSALIAFRFDEKEKDIIHTRARRWSLGPWQMVLLAHLLAHLATTWDFCSMSGLIVNISNWKSCLKIVLGLKSFFRTFCFAFTLGLLAL